MRRSVSTSHSSRTHSATACARTSRCSSCSRSRGATLRGSQSLGVVRLRGADETVQLAVGVAAIKVQTVFPVKTSRRLFRSFLSFALVFASAGQMLAAQAYIMVDAKTVYVVQERNSRQKRQVGSLTKIATAMVVLDWAEHKGGDLGQMATVPPDAMTGVSENLVGLQPGDEISLRDALYAALVQSDNVAAYTLADHVGRAIQGIVPAG